MKTIIVRLPVEGAIRYSREIVGFLSLGNVFVESRTPCIFASKDFCSQGHVTTTIHSDFCCIYYDSRAVTASHGWVVLSVFLCLKYYRKFV